MIEIRLHGRGGQGAVTSAELLAIAAINKGKYAQAFPSFGPERRGAPVTAFLRIADNPIRTRAEIYNPDVVLVLDPSILRLVNVSAGIKDDGVVIANSKFTGGELQQELKILNSFASVNATKIAMEELGLPITNTTMIGALLKVRQFVTVEDMVDPFNVRFGRIAEKNLKTLKRAYEETNFSERSEAA
jgi:pyruvate ferredoxin oxidoreductase gamma subunit